MINGLGVLGFGVGGIEAEAVLLGQPLSQPTPTVIGLKLTGRLGAGATATDLVLTVTEMLRAHGVVGKFVELYGAGPVVAEPRRPGDDLEHVAGVRRHRDDVPDRRRDAALHGADRPPGRDDRADRGLRQGAGPLPHRRRRPTPSSTRRSSSTWPRVEPSLAGPRRPQDRVAARRRGRRVPRDLLRGPRANGAGPHYTPVEVSLGRRQLPAGDRLGGDRGDHELHQHLEPVGDGGRRAAGQEGRRARPAHPALGQDQPRPGQPRGDRLPRHAPGSRPSSTSCASTSWATAARPASATPARWPSRSRPAIEENGLVAAAVLSGNRNFEGRIHPQIRASYLASPPLVVAYALAGRVDIDLTSEPLGEDGEGNPVYLSEIWPTPDEVAEADRRLGQPRAVRVELLHGLRRRRPLARAAGARGRHLRLGPGVDLRPAAALLHRHRARARRR